MLLRWLPDFTEFCFRVKRGYKNPLFWMASHIPKDNQHNISGGRGSKWHRWFQYFTEFCFGDERGYKNLWFWMASHLGKQKHLWNNHVQKGRRNRCYFGVHPILQSFVLGMREATRIHDFGWPLLFRENRTSIIFLVVADRCYFGVHPILQSFVLGMWEVILFGWFRLPSNITPLDDCSI